VHWAFIIKLLAPVVFLLGLVMYMFRKPAVRPAPTPPAAVLNHAPTPGHASVTPTSDARPGVAQHSPPKVCAALPKALAELRLLSATDLPAAQVAAMVHKIGVIPRPPHALHQLVSPEFLAEATSAELSTLVMAEPQVAAKVLAGANTPFYGLPKPLASVGQAITFLGMNTVRSICLRYLLEDSFKQASPELKRQLDQLWSASAFASELCFKLAQLLQMADPGALVTQVVLSFLGQQAACSLLPAEVVRGFAAQGLLQRVNIEQAQLGLGAAEIGHLLMQAWALPANVIDDVRDIDRVLVMPAPALGAPRSARLALCYLCARLGERLASGDIRDFAAFDLTAEQGVDFFYLHGYLAEPALARLPEFLRFPEVVSLVNRMAATTQWQKK